MVSKTDRSFLSVIVLIAGIGTGLIITPSISMDPINIPKLSVLVPSAFVILGVLLLSLKKFLLSANRVFLTLLLLFLIQITLVLLLAEAPFNQQFFGVSGRNTGFLAYFSLVFLSLGASFASSAKMLERISYSAISIGILSALYGLLQTTGNDPIKWNNPYNSVITFLGNPNFASSSLGMCSVAAFALLLGRKRSIVIKGLLLALIITSVALTLLSKSQQGTLVFAAGSFAVLTYFLLKHPKFQNKKIIGVYFFATLTVGFITILGMLNQGPLGSLLYKASVRQRGFYWDAARDMMFSHPFFGIGLDSYGDWYFAKRSANAATLTPTTQSNSAHSIFLDLGSAGGIPLFLINIALVLLTAIAIFKLIKRHKTFEWPLAAVIGMWVAYESQALISINQLGLGVWGWIFMGLIIGYEHLTRSDETENLQPKNGRNSFSLKSKNSKESNLVYLGGIIGLVIGMVITIPIFQADANFRKAIGGSDANLVIKASTAYPEDLTRTLQLAEALYGNELKTQADELLGHILIENPRSYNAWLLKFNVSEQDSAEWKEAKSKLEFLNPNVPIQ
jgi:O-antigen ligase